VGRLWRVFKYHWWELNNPDGTYDFYAHGKYDRIIFVAPRKNVVIVRPGNALDENVRWPLVIQALADKLPWAQENAVRIILSV
jgi:hypothetical protein